MSAVNVTVVPVVVLLELANLPILPGEMVQVLFTSPKKFILASYPAAYRVMVAPAVNEVSANCAPPSAAVF